MKPITILLLFASLACFNSMIVEQDGDDHVLYTINNKRYHEIFLQMEQPSSNDQKLTLLNTYITAFGFTCHQVWGLLQHMFSDDFRLQGLEVLMNNIVDPENKQPEIINLFFSSSSKQKAANLLANITRCQTVGVAPDVFPYPVLNYTSAWNDTDFNALLSQILGVSFSPEKVAIAQTAIMNTSCGLTANQTVKLFGAFRFSNDMVALAKVINQKIMGVFVAEMQQILLHLSMSTDRLSTLLAFKSAIIDVENKYNILDLFSFSNDKERARLILDDLRPKSFIFDVPTGNCVFVLDYSASMDTKFTLSTGEKMSRLQFVQREFEKTALNLDKNSKFNIVLFKADAVAIFKNGLVNATLQNIKEGIEKIQRIPPSSSSDIWDGLNTAWNMPNVETIYLLTAGVPTYGIRDIDRILDIVKRKNQIQPVKINTIAFLMGTAPNDDKPRSKAFMKSMADLTNGTYRALESDQ